MTVNLARYKPTGEYVTVRRINLEACSNEMVTFLQVKKCDCDAWRGGAPSSSSNVKGLSHRKLWKCFLKNLGHSALGFYDAAQPNL